MRSRSNDRLIQVNSMSGCCKSYHDTTTEWRTESGFSVELTISRENHPLDGSTATLFFFKEHVRFEFILGDGRVYYVLIGDAPKGILWDPQEMKYCELKPSVDLYLWRVLAQGLSSRLPIGNTLVVGGQNANEWDVKFVYSNGIAQEAIVNVAGQIVISLVTFGPEFRQILDNSIFDFSVPIGAVEDCQSLADIGFAIGE